jgi:hypothetical protein
VSREIYLLGGTCFGVSIRSANSSRNIELLGAFDPDWIVFNLNQFGLRFR